MRSLPLLLVASALSACGGDRGGAPLPSVSAIVVSAPSSTLAFGASMQLTATALAPDGRVVAGVTGFTWASSDPATVAVSESGVATAVFRFGERPPATVTATLIRGAVTVDGSLDVATGPPEVFDHAALLLSEFEQPEPVPTPGQGAAFFVFDGASVRYTVAWSLLSGPAAAVSIRGPAGASEIAGALVDLPPEAQTSGAGSAIGIFTAADLRPEGMSLADLLSLMDRGEAYVEVGTAGFPSGEIRGQVVAISRFAVPSASVRR